MRFGAVVLGAAGGGGRGRRDGGQGQLDAALVYMAFPERVSWDLGGGWWEPEHIPIGIT